MINYLSQKLTALAKELEKPLYVVGGAVRGFLINGEIADDIDLAGAITSEELLPALNKVGFKVKAVYPRTHTIMFSLGEKEKYEFTSFREESYEDGGAHKPKETTLTCDIEKDARRRDFKCNAVYYDIKNGQFVDPLGGIEDIKNKVLDTVRDADSVFESDGLRLLRLCRFAGELGFTPDKKVINSAKHYAKNVTFLSGERIIDEINKMLVADGRYTYSPKDGHYRAFKICQEIGVLKYIFPELSLGEGMPQRKDFHRYDVLEHSFRALLYSDKSVRLAALLHDIGKAVVYLRDGTYHFHDVEGAEIARKQLTRLKASRSVIDDTYWLILNHMYDLKVDEPEHEVKRFITSNYGKIERLLLLKEADILASNPDLVPFTVVRWRKLLEVMKKQRIPLSVKELAIDGNDLEKIGLRGKIVGVILDRLFDKVLDEPCLNDKAVLLQMAKDIKDGLI